MPRAVQLWFDYASPFAYLAATQAEAMAARAEARLVWRPILLGGLFRDIGQVDVPLHAMSEARRRYTLTELQRWADWWAVPVTFPTPFPTRTVLALRVTLGRADPGPLVRRIFHAAWGEGRDVGDPAVLTDCGVTADELRRASEQRDTLRANNTEAMANGVFGVPTFQLDDGTLFWGQDRMDAVERALAGRR